MRIERWIGIAGVVAVVAAGGSVPAGAQGGPLTVDEAVRIALRENRGFRQTVDGVGIVEGQRLDAIASMLPQASGSLSYSKSKQTRTFVGIPLRTVTNAANPMGMVTERGDISTEGRSSGSGLGLTLEESFSLSLWHRYRGSQADVTGARYGREAAAQTLAFTVRQQFYTVLMAKDLLSVQEEALQLARDQERRIDSMFELGSVARVDVLKARVQVSDAEVAVIRQQNAVDIETSRLAALLGFRPDRGLEISGALDAEYAAVDSSAVANEALARPDLRQAEASLRGASNLYKASLLSRLPSLFASFTLSSSSGSSEDEQITTLDFPGQPGAGDTTSVLFAFPIPKSDLEFESWQLRVGASVNLDAFLNMGQHKSSRARRLQAEHYLEGLELDIQQEIEEAILNYRASHKAIGAAERGVESAQEDLRLSQERYQQGLGTVLELLEAQVNLTRARNGLVVAKAGLKVSEAALDKARGAALPY
jgi:outer membrane protein TolC